MFLGIKRKLSLNVLLQRETDAGHLRTRTEAHRANVKLLIPEIPSRKALSSL